MAEECNVIAVGATVFVNVKVSQIEREGGLGEEEKGRKREEGGAAWNRLRGGEGRERRKEIGGLFGGSTKFLKAIFFQIWHPILKNFKITPL